MSTATPSLFGRITAVEDDHGALLAMLGRLRAHHVSLLLDPPETDSSLAPLVEELKIRLVAHFAAEENDNYFGSLVTQNPFLRDPVEELRSDHRRIERAVTDLQDAVWRGGAARLLATHLGNLLERLQDHERRESIVVREFLSGNAAE